MITQHKLVARRPKLLLHNTTRHESRSATVCDCGTSPMVTWDSKSCWVQAMQALAKNGSKCSASRNTTTNGTTTHGKASKQGGGGGGDEARVSSSHDLVFVPALGYHDWFIPVEAMACKRVEQEERQMNGVTKKKACLISWLRRHAQCLSKAH